MTATVSALACRAARRGCGQWTQRPRHMGQATRAARREDAQARNVLAGCQRRGRGRVGRGLPATHPGPLPAAQSPARPDGERGRAASGGVNSGGGRAALHDEAMGTAWCTRRLPAGRSAAQRATAKLLESSCVCVSKTNQAARPPSKSQPKEQRTGRPPPQRRAIRRAGGKARLDDAARQPCHCVARRLSSARRPS